MRDGDPAKKPSVRHREVITLHSRFSREFATYRKSSTESLGFAAHVSLLNMIYSQYLVAASIRRLKRYY